MKRFSFPEFRSFSVMELIVIVAVFTAVFSNTAFFSSAVKIYPLAEGNMLFIGSLFLLLTSLFIVVLSIFCHKILVKPVLIFFLILSSMITYFMNQYGIIVDDTMIENILETDVGEVRDLINYPLFVYVIILGILPSLFIYYAKLTRPGRKAQWVSRLKLVGASLGLVAVIFLSFSAQFISSFRMQRALWKQVVPTYTLKSVIKVARIAAKSASYPALIVGADAKISASDKNRELVIMVVGETARADKFSLNGYERETNPLLKKEKIVNFTDFWSCATTTAESVPCIFSHYPRAGFDKRKAKVADNVLDILKRSGVSVLWRDNNSSSKGVADRVKYEVFQTPATNPVCDVECRDIGMLSGLQDFIDKRPDGDIMIVLHQKGNHGPAYYKRYPPEFEKFKPTCKTSNMGACSDQEIINAYDNGILYTDYFLSRVINFLKQNDETFETAMVYVSDHGESLGENGLYLHGLPYFLAPETQKRIPAVMWFGKKFEKVTSAGMEETRKKKLSHDNIFSTLLGLFEVKSSAYDPKMDILNSARPENW